MAITKEQISLGLGQQPYQIRCHAREEYWLLEDISKDQVGIDIPFVVAVDFKIKSMNIYFDDFDHVAKIRIKSY